MARGRDHNPGVFGIRRTLTHLLLCLSIVSTSLLAQEHVHEAEPGHHRSVVHRHVELHGHGATSVEDGDGHVIWLDDVAIQTIARGFAQPAAVLVDLFQFAPADLEFTPPRHDMPAPDHGPPRTSLSLRAPPSASV